MSIGGWSTLSAGTGSAGGWGGGRPAPPSDEALFQSLSPVNGMVTGEQVKSVFQSSGLPSPRLAQIWTSVDTDKDGKITLPQFIMAMSMIRQAKQGPSLQASMPAAGFANFSSPVASPMADPLSQTWATPSLLSQQSTPQGGTKSEGWTLKTQDKRKYVMQFNLLDKNKTGKLSGTEVSPIMSQFGLHTGTLSKIWELADLDKDGHLSQDEFVVAMALLEGVKAGLSLPRVLPQELYPGPTKYATVDRKATTQSKFANFPPTSSDALSKTWASPSPASLSQQNTPSSGKEGWQLNAKDMKKYVIQFNALDKNTTGKLTGAEVSPIMSQFGLHTGTLSKIWELADLGKDGYLSADEFVIAMALAEGVKAGLSLPRVLPQELYPGPSKFATIDRKASSPRTERPLEKRSSVIDPADWASRQSLTLDDPGLSFEDKRKENFEAGRLELDRRRRALQEEQERVAAEKERKKREEEERRLQQEHEAEAARQAELDRQHLKALEIEKERERQMQKLALQREAEQRELERKRKEEWARKRQAELVGERTKERSSLHLLRDQHSNLEQELQMLDQRRIGAQASVERQKAMCVEISKVIRSLQLSRDIRLEELRKAQGELNTLQARVSTLHQQRGVLQASLDQRMEGSGYQTTRQTLKDKFIGLAALMAGLRANLSHNTEEINKLRTSFKEHQHTLEGLTSTQQSEDIKTRQLRIMVETRKREWSERQRQEQAEREAKAAEEKRAREEQERTQREIEERAKKEERLAKIKQDQEMARKKAALESVMADLSAANTPPLSRKPAPPTAKKASPPVAKKAPPAQTRPVPMKRNKKEEAAKDKEVMKKVAELQARKQQLQKQRSEQGKDTPTKPAPYAAHKLKKPKADKAPPKEEQRLLDLVSTWDSSSGTLVGIRQFKQDTSQILQPSKPGEEGMANEVTTPTTIDHVVVSSTQDGNVQVSALDSNQPISDDMSIYAVPRPLASRPITSEAMPTSGKVQSSTETTPTSYQGQNSNVAAQSSSDTTQAKVPIRYRAIYDYETSDPSEVNLREGDIVTFDPSIDAPTGWLMVGVASGETGWAPESYLERLPEEAEVESEVLAEERVVSPPNQMATVLFSWQGSKDNHLSIVKGERIAIIQQGDKWWSGEKDRKVGWFPRTFVKLEESKEEKTSTEATVTALENISTAEAPRPAEHVTESTNQNAPRGQMYEAIYDYDSTTEGDLTFKAGDVIEITASEGEWWTGVLNGVKGIFPSNYVQPRYEVAPPQPSSAQGSPSHLTPSPSHVTPSTHHTESQGTVDVLSKPAVAKVVVAFQAQKDGQLSLALGDLIKVSKQAGNGWWEGELQARGRQRVRGWFPANRVELLGQRKSSTSQTSVTSVASRCKSPLLDVLGDTHSSGSSENLVLALYTYDATSTDELSFHKGSVVTVLSKEGEWWRGELNGEKGLFPSNYVQPLMEQQAPSSEPTRWADSVSADILEAVSDQERKRQEAIFELVTSERYYTDSLKLVKEVFFDPMREADVLTDEELNKVVVNWDELIQCSSDLLKAFMVRLRTSGAVVKFVGDVLSNQIPELTPHVRWCSCQLTACTILQQKTTDPQFKEFEQHCIQDSRTGGLPLSSFLLKPMQRVTKYPLLIKRILDYTVEGELDFNDLQKALERAERLCDQVNEAVRHKENTEQLEWLQTHIHFTLDENLVFNSATNFMGSRRVLHWGKLFKIRGAKDVIAFLFNDFFLMAKPKLFFPRAATPADLEPFGKNEFTMYRQPFLLDGLRAKKAPEDQYGPSVFLLTHSEDKDIPLRADSDHVRDQWLKIITRAGLEYITTKKKMDREKKELRMRTMKDSVGFLKVTVVEASDLLAKDPNGKSDPFCVLTLGGQQEQTTSTVQNNLNPKWNQTIEFHVHDINKEEIEVTVFDKDLFSPNDFLGCAKVSLKDLFRDGDSPWTKRLLLEDVNKGEIELRIELELRASDLLL